MLDLRYPIGWFFAVVGVIVAGYGIFVPEARPTLTTANVNLYCGLFMIAFGAFFLALAWRGSHTRS
jgi:uncharacterized membrane protein HdeD (DUF308 family)